MKVENVETRESYLSSFSGLVLVKVTFVVIGSSNLGVVFFTRVYYSYEFSYELLLLAAVDDCFYLGLKLPLACNLSLLLLKKLSKSIDLGTLDDCEVALTTEPFSSLDT